MVRASTAQGLIVATNRQITAALDELIECCGWPALLSATPQRFRRQLLLAAPRVSLFWLDDQSDLASTIQLLTWLGSYERAARRIAVAYRLPTNVEVVIRGAGAHLYLAANDNIRELVDGWMPCWLRGEDRGELASRSFALRSPAGLQTALEVDLHSSEPP